MSDHYSSLAAELLRQQPEEPDRTNSLTRDEGIDVVRRAMERQKVEAQRGKWRTFVPLAAAAGVVLALGWTALKVGFDEPKNLARSGEPAHEASVESGNAENSLTEASSAAPRGGTDRTAAERAESEPGHITDRVFTPGQSIASGRGHPTVVKFERGTEITLDEQSELEYRHGPAVRRFGLLRGAVTLTVAHLAAGQRFIVETPDAEVEVRGTRFRVELLEEDKSCAGAQTRVFVEEGVVEVRFAGETHQVWPNELWPATCTTHDGVRQSARRASQAGMDDTLSPAEVALARHPAAGRSVRRSAASPAPARVATSARPERLTSPNAVSGDVQEVVAPEPGGSPGSAAGAASAPPQSGSANSQPIYAPSRQPNLRDVVAVSSSLALQNQLFAEAVAARKAGRVDEALANFQRLMTHFPDGPLTESAAVERIRLLRRLNRGQARAEAESYLSQYPRGFARQEMAAFIALP